jgi:hypothetical protein
VYPSGDKVKETLNEIEQWVADPFNQSFMFQEPLAIVNNYVSGHEAHIGKLLASLTSLSHWYAAIEVTQTMAGKEGDGFFALGLLNEGDVIGRESLVGLREGWFYGVGLTCLTPFVIKLFAKWANIDLLPEECRFEIADEYVRLVEGLNAPPDEIRTAIAEACDFHLSRSKEHTDEDTFEFADSVYAVYPVEILMFFRIRQALGLNNPRVDHPLLASPLGKLRDNKCTIRPALKPVFDKIVG